LSSSYPLASASAECPRSKRLFSSTDTDDIVFNYCSIIVYLKFR
jgi:hypothetical protein